MGLLRLFQRRAKAGDTGSIAEHAEGAVAVAQNQWVNRLESEVFPTESDQPEAIQRRRERVRGDVCANFRANRNDELDEVRNASRIQSDLSKQDIPPCILRPAELKDIFNRKMPEACVERSAPLLAMMVADAALEVKSCIGPEGEASLVRADESEVRFDWWRSWPQLGQPDTLELFYSYMAFEFRIDGGMLQVSQYTGTLWFQQRILKEIAELVELREVKTKAHPAPQPELVLELDVRVDLVNNYKKHFADIHRLYTGSAPLPVPRIYKDSQGLWQTDALATHLRTRLENEERAAKFHLRYCPDTDSLIHFNLKGLGAGEGEGHRIAQHFKAAENGVSRVVHYWGERVWA